MEGRMPMINIPIITTWIKTNIIQKSFDSLLEIETEFNEKKLAEAHNLRKQIYVDEKHFLTEDVEKDEYDYRADHVIIIHKSTQKVIATTRIIYPKLGDLDNSFPIQEIFPWLLVDKNTVEISRFVIQEDFRNGKITGIQVRLALLKGIMKICWQTGIENWYSILDPFLFDNLKKASINIKQIAKKIEHHGLRVPTGGNFKEMTEYCWKHEPALASFLTNKNQYFPT